MLSPLAHSGWISFNEEKWGLTATCIEHGDPDSSGAYARMHVYVDRAGRVTMPGINPYLPVGFRPTASKAPHRLNRQWLEASGDLAHAMSRLDWAGSVPLDPGVTDVRQWQWHGYRAEVNYTYHIDFPYDLAQASSAIRKHVQKAKRAGYTCERTEDLDAVLRCLDSTETRQGFQYPLSKSDLARVLSLMGEEFCRAYLCRDRDGGPASARVVLHQPGARAVDWVAGTRTEHLRHGATQLLISDIFNDLNEAHAVGFDYGGANLPNIAASKAEWGGDLVPFYVLRSRNLRTIARDARQWVRTQLRTLRTTR